MKKRDEEAWVWLGACCCALFVLMLLYQAWIFAHVCWWIKFNPSTSAFMDDRLEMMQDKNPKAELQYKWVAYTKISNNLKRALIAAEDAKFVDHEGFDWDGIQKAYEKNLKKGKIVAGGSTISQQLAKNLFLSTKRTPWRKAEEAVITRDAGSGDGQAAHLRDLSERHRMGQRRLRRRSGRPPLLPASAPRSCRRNRLPSSPPWCPIRATTTNTAKRAACAQDRHHPRPHG